MKTAILLLMGAALLAAAPPGLTPVNEASYPNVLASAKGQVLVVDFWATWCIPCREETPKLVSLSEQYKARGVRLITVSCDEPEQESGAVAFLAKHKVPQPAYVKHAKNDEAFINLVDSKWNGALPGLFVYNREGKLVKSFVGETDMTALEAVLKTLL